MFSLGYFEVFTSLSLAPWPDQHRGGLCQLRVVPICLTQVQKNTTVIYCCTPVKLKDRMFKSDIAKTKDAVTLIACMAEGALGQNPTFPNNE